jgi:DNA polymerase-3 subunit epsilon
MSGREIVLDTETTGLDPGSGHRLVEIGCVELVNHMRTGAVFHTYLNPERDMPPEAERVHGLSVAFLSDKPRFAEKAAAFEAFIGSDKLIIHNAAFDVKFLNAELTRIGRPALQFSRVLDTLDLARRRFPGAMASLDGLCKRFNIDLSGRTLHGALLDAELLAEVYLELLGGRQPALLFDAAGAAAASAQARKPVRPRPRVLPSLLTEAERLAHEVFLAGFPVPALWRQTETPDEPALKTA